MEGSEVTKVQEEVQEGRKYGYRHRLGEEIKVHFKDGKSLKGKLLKAFTYEIMLEIEVQGEIKEVTIFKGAIKYIVCLEDSKN